MIQEVKMYTVVCNNCGDAYVDEYSGFGAWYSQNSAIESATNNNWIEDNDKHYCPDCAHYDNNDGLIINERRKN